MAGARKRRDFNQGEEGGASKWIWMDGKVVPWADAKVHVSAHAIHYGSSVFEGVRGYPTAAGGVAVFCLAQHMKRFAASCKISRLHPALDTGPLASAILELVALNGHKSAYVRPFAFRGVKEITLDHRAFPLHQCVYTFEAADSLIGDKEQGVDVMVSTWRRMAPDTHPALAKVGGNYVLSSLAAIEAADHGYAEAIFLDVGGHVAEAATENIFLVRDGVVHTPQIGNSILAGVTRMVVEHLCGDLGIAFRETVLPRESLYVADEIFLTGTSAEIVPVRSVDKVQIGAGVIGPVTRRLYEEFHALTHGRVPDRHGWLTPVPPART